jgi:hypothetical protein
MSPCVSFFAHTRRSDAFCSTRPQNLAQGFASTRRIDSRSFAHRFITSSRAGMGRRRESLGAAPAEPIGKRAETLPQGASPAEAYGFVGFVLTGASSATTRDRGFRPQILVVTSRFSRRRIRDAAFRREGATSAATDAEARDTRTRRSPARALLTS